MNHQVLLTARAERELYEAAAWIAQQAPSTAQTWLDGFLEVLAGLEQHPERCACASEQAVFPFELRQLLYGRRRSYRALFTILDDLVVVLAIRHAAQDALQSGDL